jgi:hypothetical protein
LRATFPPRPDSSKSKPYQQYLSLGIYANPAGFKRAEAEAHKVASLLAIGKFDWSEYFQESQEEAKPIPISQWIEKLETEYFAERVRTKKTESTWDKEYLRVLKKLPSQKSLTSELLTELIYSNPC